MIHTIKTYIEKNRLLPSGQPVITGFSGGSDSVALLHILNCLGYTCIAAHCNFHLRESEADRDELFCRQFAENHRILFEKADFDTKLHVANQHISIEMAARELRYTWFETLRKKYDAQAIAVAHHRNDSHETMLLNLIRGTGIRGLRGISPQNGWIVRPLLCVDKDDIYRYIAEHHLSFVTDSSNLSEAFTRNIIRLRLLPLMKEINPSIEEALTRTATHLTDVENIYQEAITKAKQTLLKKTDDETFHIPINELLHLTAPNAILYEILHPFGFTRQLSENVFNALSGESGKIFDAPDSGYQLLKDRTSLFIYKKPGKNAEIFQIEEQDTDFERLPIRLSFQKIEITKAFKIAKSPSIATFDYDKLRFPLLLRKWQPGDRFIPFGMKGRKKVSDYFSDRKYSLLQKNKTWLLCSGNDIIWIVGERTDSRFRIENHSKYAFIVNFS